VRTTWADIRDRRGAIAVAIAPREAEWVPSGYGKGQRGGGTSLDPGINSNLPQTFLASHSATPLGSRQGGMLQPSLVRHDAAEPARQPPGPLGCPRSTARQWRPGAAAARAPPPVDAAIMTTGTRSTSQGYSRGCCVIPGRQKGGGQVGGEGPCSLASPGAASPVRCSRASLRPCGCCSGRAVRRSGANDRRLTRSFDETSTHREASRRRFWGVRLRNPL